MFWGVGRPILRGPKGGVIHTTSYLLPQERTWLLPFKTRTKGSKTEIMLVVAGIFQGKLNLKMWGELAKTLRCHNVRPLCLVLTLSLRIDLARIWWKKARSHRTFASLRSGRDCYHARVVGGSSLGLSRFLFVGAQIEFETDSPLGGSLSLFSDSTMVLLRSK